jgi:hypothetical protein
MTARKSSNTVNVSVLLHGPERIAYLPAQATVGSHSMDEVTILPRLTALEIAYLLAIPIAWDREKEDRSAGLRTFPLVAIATCGFIEGTENFLRGSPEAQARVIEADNRGRVHRRRCDLEAGAFGSRHRDCGQPVGYRCGRGCERTRRLRGRWADCRRYLPDVALSGSAETRNALRSQTRMN